MLLQSRIPLGSSLIHDRAVMFVLGIVLGVIWYELLTFLPWMSSSADSYCISSSSSSSAAAIKDETRLLAQLLEQPPPARRHFGASIGPPPASMMKIKASRLLFQDMPESNRTTFHSNCGKNCHPVIRAFREVGWQKVDTFEEGRVLHSAEVEEWYASVEGNESVDPGVSSWQRYNHISNSSAWGRKENMLDGFVKYQRHVPNHRYPYFLPETYRLHVESERNAFLALFGDKKRVGEGRGHAWTLTKESDEGQEIIMFPPNSKSIDAELHLIPAQNETWHYMQKDLCETLTWSDGNNMMIRVFWLVASVDPLLVFYQDGYARIGYNELQPDNLRMDQKVVSFADFEGFLRTSHNKQTPGDSVADPVHHVRNQFKETIAIFVDSFQNDTFRNPKGQIVEDAYEIYALDFVLDRNLRVSLHAAWTGTSAEGKFEAFMMEDYYFLLEKKHEVYYGTVRLLLEIWDKQESGNNILPLTNAGMWELVVAKDWKYSYPGHSYSGQRRPLCNAQKRLQTRNE